MWKRIVQAGTILWVLALMPVDVHAQSSVFEPGFMQGAKEVCYDMDPYCSPLAHASITLGFSGAMDWAGVMDAEDARWIPAAFYFAKEVYDYKRAHDVIPLHDHAIDLAGAALGWWLSDVIFGD